MEAQKQERDMLRQKELLQVSGLYKTYEGKSSGKQAAPVINGASFSIQANETVGLVGSSGAGKSTIGRIIAGIEQADKGQLIYQGQDLLSMKPKARREATRSIQMIFQDPYESLSARMTIAQLIAEPLVIARLYKNDPARRTELVREALQEVALPPERYMHRYAHELSGGERQRVGLARAFVTRPQLIVADEPTSMLDTSLRLDLLRLMRELSLRHGIAYLFITHDLALTRGFCDRLLVLDQGQIVETGTPEEVTENPQHPFTLRLIGAVRELDQF
ncbi:ATP-binding cassette domain-containing protein [Brevibacillus agri]|uniref:ABC transporter ATP-binding protein n=3 Tax=Brevibacillus TaxID=55080 RepID=UPI00047033F4|nr:ATP-binding cassette domain-containing protein [Brevibacillus agri]MDN4093825.1 ATP-binding cassette domain-containing protein [Brevibacillus agri]MED1642603.1 ATP-binding cassette domain-containing protein [Brevibacillus agri]MED1653161.1 ATP-binding cassette domain-containing protein [Brevibacillus agri]MED1686846.1 ATP-binding cassette domain-containing protein [Brevibacillus agri]MED1692163.1 ATP-binding cassette domain-containing protein [Brevibacillus agri]